MSLLPQQAEAKNKLQSRKVGAFFMEAGTGKTRPVVELTERLNPDYVLYVAPLRTIKTEDVIESVVYQVNLWGGFGCEHDFVGVESIGMSDRVYLESYDKLSKSKRPVLIVDESLKIKNADAKRTQRLLTLSKLVEFKYILNGTPLSRNLLDLWSQMEFLSPKILKMGIAEFKNTFCEYKELTIRKPGAYKSRSKEWIVRYHNLDYLYALIEPYVFECDLQLDVNKQYINLNYCLSPEEKEKHQKIIETILDNEWLMAKPNFFLELTQKLQNNYSRTEEKFQLLEAIEESHNSKRIIVFAKYIETQELLKKRFPKLEILSYQKHSFGLNKQQYNVCVFFDKVWDYALREQAERRIYRIKQMRECFFYDLTGDVGLESLIDKNVSKKSDLSQEFKKLSLEEFKKIAG